MTSAPYCLERNRIADAIVILKLNVTEYPKSGDVYDSLADAYDKGGQRQLAIDNYRKAMAIDPKNQSARDKLKALEGS